MKLHALFSRKKDDSNIQNIQDQSDLFISGIRFIENNNTSKSVINNLARTWNSDLTYDISFVYLQNKLTDCKCIYETPSIFTLNKPDTFKYSDIYSEDPILSAEILSSLINGLQSNISGASLNIIENDPYLSTKNILIDRRFYHEYIIKCLSLILEKSHPLLIEFSDLQLNNDVMEHSEIYNYMKLIKYNGLYFKYIRSLEEAAMSSDDISLISKENINTDHKLICTNNNYDAKTFYEKINSKIDSYNEINFYSEHEKSNILNRFTEESTVLLKNDSSLLPIDKTKKIGIIGSISDTKGDDLTRQLIECFASDGVDFSYSPITQEKADLKDAEDICKDNNIILLLLGSENKGRTLELSKYIELITFLNKNIIAVIDECFETQLEFFNNVPAIISVGYITSSTVNHFYNILSGKFSPSGRLAKTIPQDFTKDPSFTAYSLYENDLEVKHSIYYGYRFFSKSKDNIRYPFGHGLTYNDIEYKGLRLVLHKDYLTIKFSVTNKGNIPCSEVVQVYIKDTSTDQFKSGKELKKFARIHLKAQETKSVDLKLNLSEFAYFDPIKNKITYTSGNYEIQIGRSSEDIRIKKDIRLQLTSENPEVSCLYDKELIQSYIFEKKDRLAIPHLEFKNIL